jgi:hypothetical protein
MSHKMMCGRQMWLTGIFDKIEAGKAQLKKTNKRRKSQKLSDAAHPLSAYFPSCSKYIYDICYENSNVPC